jgi:NifB/MoaA-like Fe-S oxidoreductase
LQGKFQQKFGIRFVYATDEWYLVADRTPPPVEEYDGQELHENGLGMVRHFLDEWITVKQEINRWLVGNQIENQITATWTDKTITLVTASLFAPTLRRIASEFSQITQTVLDVQAVANRRLGETITVAGLLMSQDVLAHLQDRGYGELVLLPRVMFDHPDTISLDDVSPQEIADALGCTIALADTMGDVWDAITGSSTVIFHPNSRN